MSVPTIVWYTDNNIRIYRKRACFVTQHIAKLLSDRLTIVAGFVPQGAIVADIGTDHAYLPIYLVHEGIAPKVVASDVGDGPVASATRNVREAQVTAQVSVREGDGLATLTADDAVNCVVIAGMGGALITEILDRGLSHLRHQERLILQPNVGGDRVREWLAAHQYGISAERIIDDDHHIYEIIVADPVLETVTLDPADVLMGPQLRREKNSVWQAFWQERHEKNEKLLSQLSEAHSDQREKVDAVQREQQMIEEALKA